MLWHYFRNACKFTCGRKAVKARPYTHIYSTQTHANISACRHAKNLKTTCSNSHMHTQGLSHLCQNKRTPITLIRNKSTEHWSNTRRPCERTKRVRQDTGATTVVIKHKNKLRLLRLALLLTEDNHLRTASPCCLALCVSACLRLSECTHRATVDHWQHHPRPVLQPAVTDECPRTVWLSDQSVGGGETKTGPRAESASVNCHFLLSAYSLSCLFDPSTVYLCAYSPQKNPVFPTHLFFYRFVASKPTGQLDKKVFKSQFWAKSNAHIILNHWKVSGASIFRKINIMIFFLCWAFKLRSVIFLSCICSYTFLLQMCSAWRLFWGRFLL